jgi:hypothetical protein
MNSRRWPTIDHKPSVDVVIETTVFTADEYELEHVEIARAGATNQSSPRVAAVQGDFPATRNDVGHSPRNPMSDEARSSASPHHRANSLRPLSDVVAHSPT